MHFSTILTLILGFVNFAAAGPVNLTAGNKILPRYPVSTTAGDTLQARGIKCYGAEEEMVVGAPPIFKFRICYDTYIDSQYPLDDMLERPQFPRPNIEWCAGWCTGSTISLTSVVWRSDGQCYCLKGCPEPVPSKGDAFGYWVGSDTEYFDGYYGEFFQCPL